MSKEQEEKLKQLEEKAAELENNWKRALADYRNLQKRTAEEKLEFVEFTSQVWTRKLLSILDNLEILEKHSPEDVGLKLIVKDFKRVLEEEGVREIEVLGKDFDAQTMEAIEMVEGEFNKVIEVLNKGYMVSNKLVRPARVKVGSTKKEEK
jgi:molecular chaperone GrpE